MAKIKVKRIVPIFTVVTERFKKEIEENSLGEMKMLDNQIVATTTQIRQLQSRFGLLKNSSTQVAQEQVNHAIIELSDRLEQLKKFKATMAGSFDDMKKKSLGEQVQTGIIENYVELNPGDNIKNIFERAKIVVKDDVIQEIVE